VRISAQTDEDSAVWAQTGWRPSQYAPRVVSHARARIREPGGGVSDVLDGTNDKVLDIDAEQRRRACVVPRGLERCRRGLAWARRPLAVHRPAPVELLVQLVGRHRRVLVLGHTHTHTHIRPSGCFSGQLPPPPVLNTQQPLHHSSPPTPAMADRCGCPPSTVVLASSQPGPCK
jgi:hypothetical protein